MEPENNNQNEEKMKQTSRLQQVTPLSKYLAMALFIALPFLGAWIGYEFAPEKVVEVVKEIEVEKVFEKQDLDKEKLKETVDANLPAEYLSSNYRVVSAVENPYYSDESKYDKLIVVAPRGINDFSCGGKYVPDTCYLFLESSYADIETPEFVGIWASDSWSLRQETIKFISPTVVTFEAGFGDGGIRSVTMWEFDLSTGSSSMVSREDDLNI